MTQKSVVVFDYGTGNIHSAIKAVELAGAKVELTRDKSTCAEADGLLVPGVGAFAAVMEALNAVDGGEIIERRLAGGRPVMGICVGMQIMFANGLEGGVDTPGLGEWDETVHKLEAPILPHMGWNTVDVGENSQLFKGIEDERFYFVHSYGVTEWNLDVIPPFPQPTVTWAEHGQRFIAAVENGPLVATQFHPEKSGQAGIQLLRNWLETL
ncbi:imidazole glycerol phosphate synthase subunit HisH [Aurantimicrobium sp. MWH-Uga1]|uniref:imidazole glycerol phosphate synthase subunit HisH n=1 Tax=Aurantimicrobium sp. MWH-Uga1 TaxID=2079575 RepID=UPI000DEE0E2E|nr:imidazole glycerol phosphate synthase subunit HisH [Aurantimicrobium sp. MWH-Uga1]AXE54340.1 Imidazole glycerol phosphate synthase subunit HisH [Aurantimicrobium sp. MWH-Uga1]